ncbi:MAG: fructose-bisphosphate aldolase, partial [Rhizobiales bacterium]|nr:fructose-bisphosphate aldolase [Hyphomicrobiales bacterium]
GQNASTTEVAERTFAAFHATVPTSVPGIAFLSGGQSDVLATEHLSRINQIPDRPWAITFSYGRALQAAALKAWGGKRENIAAGQAAFLHRSRMNGLAALGQWTPELEREIA